MEQKKNDIQAVLKNKKILIIGGAILALLIVSGILLYFWLHKEVDQSKEEDRKQILALLAQEEAQAKKAEENKPDTTPLQEKAGAFNDPNIPDAKVESLTEAEKKEYEEKEEAKPIETPKEEKTSSEEEKTPSAEVKKEEATPEKETTPETKTEEKPSEEASKEVYVYVVRAQDTLYSIAKRFYGDGAYHKEIKAYNQQKDNQIQTGQKIKLPQTLKDKPIRALIYDGDAEGLLNQYGQGILKLNKISKSGLKKGMLLALPK